MKELSDRKDKYRFMQREKEKKEALLEESVVKQKDELMFIVIGFLIVFILIVLHIIDACTTQKLPLVKNAIKLMTKGVP
jgi:hypothetical protein